MTEKILETSGYLQHQQRGEARTNDTNRHSFHNVETFIAQNANRSYILSTKRDKTAHVTQMPAENNG